jgi:hypothetical protein
VHSDHWYAEVFQALPDLVRQLLPGLAAAQSGDSETDYIFRPVALKKVAHHPDGVLWPRHHSGGSAALPVVLLEVQMHSDRRFLKHDVTWVDLSALANRSDLDPMLALLTLPVRQEHDLGPCAQRILTLRPDLIELILPILSERFQGLSPSQLMATLGISKDFWRHTRAFQDILEEGREEGRAEGRAEGRREGREEGRIEAREEARREVFALTQRLLEQRCGTLTEATRARIEALSPPRLEELTLALLDFQGADDLQAWLDQQN